MATIVMELSDKEIHLLLREALMARGFVLASRATVRLDLRARKRYQPPPNDGEEKPDEWYAELHGGSVRLAVAPIEPRALPELALYPADPTMRSLRITKEEADYIKAAEGPSM